MGFKYLKMGMAHVFAIVLAALDRGVTGTVSSAPRHDQNVSIGMHQKLPDQESVPLIFATLAARSIGHVLMVVRIVADIARSILLLQVLRHDASGQACRGLPMGGLGTRPGHTA